MKTEPLGKFQQAKLAKDQWTRPERIIKLRDEESLEESFTCVDGPVWKDEILRKDFNEVIPKAAGEKTQPQLRAGEMEEEEPSVTIKVDDQCWEWIKQLKSEYQKTRDQNCTSGNSPISCPFYEFDRGLGTELSMEPTMVRDNLASRNGALLSPESNMGTAGSQQQAPSEEHEVTLFLKPVPEKAVVQDQQQTLDPSPMSIL
ncbi:hypothetical protein KIL84_017978 [Mauremys mutica]|uniref:Uncharacterized protein n=1 Tax=Mauremys mutica TaxID=74926 RepID=A0A9D3XPF6_9SAUR|nr:hypothetical protein KIL84_017978 [Mauremys mutica]